MEMDGNSCGRGDSGGSNNIGPNLISGRQGCLRS